MTDYEWYVENSNHFPSKDKMKTLLLLSLVPISIYIVYDARDN